MKLQNSKLLDNSSKFLQWTDVLKGEESSEGMDFLGDGISKEAEDPTTCQDQEGECHEVPRDEGAVHEEALCDRVDVGFDSIGFA